MTQLWFYKAPGRLFDKLIRWYTKSKYSHCEIVIDGIAYTADAWAGEVVVRPVATFNPDNWDVVDIAAPVDVGWLNQQLGKKYDWLGIFGFLLWNTEDPSRWYCSELCAAALGYTGRDISPERLWRMVTGEKND